MINFGKVKGNSLPQEMEITSNMIYIAKNIEPYTETIDDHVINGYTYDYIGYNKDEYIELLSKKSQKIDQLEEELAAAKILLGVE